MTKLGQGNKQRKDPPLRWELPDGWGEANSDDINYLNIILRDLWGQVEEGLPEEISIHDFDTHSAIYPGVQSKSFSAIPVNYRTDPTQVPANRLICVPFSVQRPCSTSELRVVCAWPGPDVPNARMGLYSSDQNTTLSLPLRLLSESAVDDLAPVSGASRSIPFAIPTVTLSSGELYWCALVYESTVNPPSFVAVPPGWESSWLGRSLSDYSGRAPSGLGTNRTSQTVGVGMAHTFGPLPTSFTLQSLQNVETVRARRDTLGDVEGGPSSVSSPSRLGVPLMQVTIDY